jgi:gluconolactonase
MYFGPPPQRIATEPFASLPDKFRKNVGGAGRGWARGNFLEGPSFDRAGNLLCVDIFCGRIYRVSPKAEWDIVAEYDGLPNGLKIHKDGRIFVADRKRGIVIIDPQTGVAQFPLPGPKAGVPFRGPNDLIFSKTGELYFTDQGSTGLQDPTGCVYRWDTKSDALECVIGNVPSPNGLVFNVSETILFLAVTRTNAVWRIELTDPERRTGLFTQIYSTGPDGLALDQKGTVLIAHPGAATVWGVSKTGVPLYQIECGAGPMPTNIAYDPGDPTMLYIIESSASAIVRAHLPVAGNAMYSHA